MSNMIPMPKIRSVRQNDYVLVLKVQSF